MILSSTSLFFVRYKTAYAVTISNEVVGYINNKVAFQKRINDEITGTNNNVAFVVFEQLPEYKLELVEKKTKTNEDEILAILKQNAEITYKYYAVTLENDTKAYLNTLEEAQQLVAELKQEYQQQELNIGISEYYTVNSDDVENIKQNADVVLAKEEVETSINEYIDRKEKTVNGIYLASTPVNGKVTSRFASIERVRSGAHTGLDIGAASGTPIKAAADGVVKNSSWMGTYGNLVIISHGNGIETYYAHCSKLLVKVGQRVSAGDTIALVGSTGNSTGPHLHFEVRINNQPVNPQNYLYK